MNDQWLRHVFLVTSAGKSPGRSVVTAPLGMQSLSVIRKFASGDFPRAVPPAINCLRRRRKRAAEPGRDQIGLAARARLLQGDAGTGSPRSRRAAWPEAQQHWRAGSSMARPAGETARPAGIRDVARLAGVSVASASFALNGQPGVADDTRKRIMAAAEQLGYRANPQAQALRRGRTSTYGFVVRNFANPFFLEVLSGAERVAGESGVTLLVLDSRYSLEREHQHVREMAAQRLAGLAIAPVGAGDSVRLWQELRPGAPVVALNAAVDGIKGVSRVSPDNVAAVELPMRRIADLGHRSVAFLAAPRTLMADPDRLRSFRRVARELPLQARVVHSPLTIADVRQHARALLSRPGRPTAIITNSDYTAHAIYKAARDVALRIGAGISVVGHDDLPTSELLEPPLATIRLDHRAMGRALMMRLLGQVPPGDFAAPVELVERASLQPPETGLSCRVYRA
ncbi:MAG TPA: LacI family transcriptional regulator [Actinobacteria bacterium]|nr:LacI family transcriptional regulator [Actinomycetota bacterium]